MSGSKLLTVLLYGLLFAGCGGTGSELVEAPKIEPPQTFSNAGETWVLTSAMEKMDEEALTKFFEIHSDYQGSTDFEGPPTMYVAGTEVRRFYWLRGSDDATAWSCVHLKDGSFQISEGSGNPFSK